MSLTATHTAVPSATRSRRPVLLAEASRAHRLVVLGLVLFVVGLAVVGALLPAYRTSQLTTVMITAIAVAGLNLATGYTGLLSIGHSALFGVGAYATGILIVQYGYSPLLTLPVATVLGLLVGIVVGLPALRIRGLYFSLVTLALGIAFPEIVRRFENLTGGAAGLLIRAQYLSPPAWTGLSRYERGIWLYWVSFLSLVVVMLLVRNLMRSRTGIAMRGTRDHEVAIRSNGVDVARVKVLTFGLSGAITAYAGGLFAMNVGALSPDGGSFTLVKSIELVTAMFIGGAGTLLGPLVGAGIAVFLPDLASTWTTGPISGVLFGAVLIVLVFFMPEGIVGRFRLWGRRFILIVPADHPAVRTGRGRSGAGKLPEGDVHPSTPDSGTPDDQGGPQ